MKDSRSGSGRREGRSVTRLFGLTVGRIAKERIPVEVDPRSGKASGPNAAKFKSYLGVLARRHVSIIIPSWDDIQEADKNLMWQDIQHEIWIAARTKSDGQMTSESTRVVTDKIGILIVNMLHEGLVEQTTQGSFISHGRDDILTTAIGRPEHTGCVRGVGGSWSHRDFFGA
uniref:Uncharacterized protein n=1 Tax=Cajanus cajan TaxID=3821 RepID=A0A151QL51_CAJCA|nr:hypothetical protein KK1_049246 [Cajanus cajan]